MLHMVESYFGRDIVSLTNEGILENMAGSGITDAFKDYAKGIITDPSVNWNSDGWFKYIDPDTKFQLIADWIDSGSMKTAVMDLMLF